MKVQARQHLPDYMVPAHLVLLECLPLMGNGKLDRRALPAPDLEQAGQHYLAPTTARQVQLAQVWREVLNVSRVGVQDNFFELGGDSILSIQVVSRARQLGLQFTPRDLFQHQTILALAEVVTEGATPTQVEQGARQGRTGLTPIQHWFFEALLLEVRQPLHAEGLEAALAALVQHHDSLRLRFTQARGQWQGEYAAASTEPLLWTATVADFADCQALYDDAQRSLDLTAGPLLRGLLLTDDAGQQRLLLAIHHLVVDGVSWRVLLEDLQALYRGHSLPAKTHAPGDWAARLTHYAGSDSRTAVRSPAGRQPAPTCPYPGDRPGPRADPPTAATGACGLPHAGQRPTARRSMTCCSPPWRAPCAAGAAKRTRWCNSKAMAARACSKTST